MKGKNKTVISISLVTVLGGDFMERIWDWLKKIHKIQLTRNQSDHDFCVYRILKQVCETK